MDNDERAVLRLSALAVILLPLLCFGGCYGCAHIQVADGYRDSTIRKVSETGVIWKTWEAESLGDGMRVSTSDKGTSVSPETFQYTITDRDVLQQVQNLPPGKRVRIIYRKQLGAWHPRGESRYFITGIEELPEPK